VNVAALAALISYKLGGQATPTRPEFEVASMRITDPGIHSAAITGGPGSSDPGRIRYARPDDLPDANGIRSELNRYSLDLGALLKALFAQLPSDARLFEAAKWCTGVEDVIAIDPHRASRNTK
jgi:hypothetical protein